MERRTVSGPRPGCQASRPQTRIICHLLTSENSQQPRWGQEGPGCPDTGREGGVPGTHVVPPASPLVLPQVQVTGASQETRLTAARSQGLGGRGHTGRDRQTETGTRDNSQSETGGAESEERDEHERRRWKNREARRETGRRRRKRWT